MDTLIIVLIVAAIVLLVVPGLAACMLSSRISRDEERHRYGR